MEDKPKTPEELAAAAVWHALNVIAEDPEKYWLMGLGTETYSKLTEAAAALSGKPVDRILDEYSPDSRIYKDYIERREAEERLLEYCKENDITAPESH